MILVKDRTGSKNGTADSTLVGVFDSKRPLYRLVKWLILHIFPPVFRLLYGFRVVGRIPEEKMQNGCISVCNHVHKLDCVMLACVFQDYTMQFLSLESNLHIPVAGAIVRLMGGIGLPANLFHGTGIPVCVLVLKSKRNGNSGNILFVDASKEFKAGKNQNVLEQEHIDKIVDAYAKRVDVDKFAHVADMSEIIENGYNLNIPRYVDTFEEEEPVDLDAVKAQIKTLDSETKAAIDKAESFMRQLGL